MRACFKCEVYQTSAEHPGHVYWLEGEDPYHDHAGYVTREQVDAAMKHYDAIDLNADLARR